MGYVKALIREAKHRKEGSKTSLATMNTAPGLLSHATLPCLHLPLLFYWQVVPCHLLLDLLEAVLLAGTTGPVFFSLFFQGTTLKKYLIMTIADIYRVFAVCQALF